MKSPIVPALLFVAALLILPACDPEGTETRPQGPHRRPGGFTGSQPTPVVDETEETTAPPTVEPTHEHDRTRTTTETPQRPTNTTPITQGNFEYGKAVPGKPGFVTSPYAPTEGWVDVRGYAPGTEVKDPYTGKTFLVPVQ